MATMSEQELDAFKERLTKLAHTGTENSVKAFIDEQFDRLPSDMQAEIMAGLFVSALEAETAEMEAAVGEPDAPAEGLDK